MHKAHLWVLGLALGAASVVSVMVARGGGSSKFHAESWLALEVRETHFLPRFDRDECRFMSQFLDRADCRSALARKSGLDEKRFTLEKVGPVRGTSMFCIQYSGADSNQVQCVASNAAHAVIHLYATNRPSWEVRYIDSECITPPSFARRMKRTLGL